MELDDKLVLRELRDAVIGNPNTGAPGILKRMDDVEEKLVVHDTKLYKLSGMLSTLYMVWEVYKYIHR